MSSEPQPAPPGSRRASQGARKLYGKYRAVVINNLDPELRGRLMVTVPHVPGSLTSWALPCVPFAGPGVGLYAVPPVGANVWVEFEGGDTQYPIWTGCFWGLGEFPLPATRNPLASPLVKVLKTHLATLILDDTPGTGGVTLEVITPAVTVPVTMTFDATGATLTCGQSVIQMTPAGVRISTVDFSATATATAAITAGANLTASATGNAQIDAKGNAEISALGSAALTAEGSARVEGASTLVSGKSGATVTSPKTEVIGTAAATVTSNGPTIVKGGPTVTISGKAIALSPV